MESWEWAEIQKTSDKELTKEHDAVMASRGLGIECFYLAAEIYHRRQSRVERSIFCLTIVITFLTAINVLVEVFVSP